MTLAGFTFYCNLLKITNNRPHRTKSDGHSSFFILTLLISSTTMSEDIISHKVVLTALARHRPTTDTRLAHLTSHSSMSPLFVRAKSTRTSDTGHVSGEAEIIRLHRATSGNVTQPRCSSGELHVYNTIFNARHANCRHRHHSHHRRIALTPRTSESQQPFDVIAVHRTIPARERRWRFDTPYNRKGGRYRGDVVDDEDEEEDEEEEQDMMRKKIRTGETEPREGGEGGAANKKHCHRNRPAYGGGYYNPIPYVNIRSLHPKGPPVPYSSGVGDNREGEINQQI